MDGRSALIVATSHYADSRLAPLEGPASDAAALQAVLAEADIGGFDVHVALDETAAVIGERLEAFFADRRREDLLLVHFSGHGLKDDDGQLYLAASDTKIDRLMSTGIEAGWVNRLMHRCRSERIALFLDCCFAGSFTSSMTRRAGADRAGVREAFAGSGLVVIAASDAMQYSFEAGRQVGEPPGPSPFTSALVNGLQTGEADLNEDGNVSIDELFDYLERRVRETSPAQTPTKSALNQSGDWVIARSTRVPSVRLLPDRVQRLLKSEQSIDRLEVIMDLERLRSRTTESRIAEAAIKALEGLTADDSRRVAARAKEVLGAATVASPGPSQQVDPPAATADARPGPQLAAGAAAIHANGPAPGTGGAEPAAARLPWGQGDVLRAVLRALLGSVIALGVALTIGLAGGASIDDLATEFANPSDGAAPGVLAASTILAAAIELGRLVLRGRGGATWRAAASHRWLEAGSVGAAVAVAGILLGSIAGGWGQSVEWLKDRQVAAPEAWMIGVSVVGFVAAEAVVDLWIRHRAA